jgi:hypothetical protein
MPESNTSTTTYYYLAYIVIPYEGIFETSIKLFESEIDAKEYIKELKKENKFYDDPDSYVIMPIQLLKAQS